MKRTCCVAAAFMFVVVSNQRGDAKSVTRIPAKAQTALVERYLTALQNGRYAAAYALLNPEAHAYYRDAGNFASIFTADGYRIESFRLIDASPEGPRGRVFFARETARYHDFAHDAQLDVTADVPVGVVTSGLGYRIKDPGHPWRAFAAQASAEANGVRIRVKKISFFSRRIEAIVTFANTGSGFVTILPYGKSLLRDSAGMQFRPIETRDWTLTDRVLFEGLRLPPQGEYTGNLSFASDALDNAPRTFALTIAPLLADGADAPFAIEVSRIRAGAPAASR